MVGIIVLRDRVSMARTIWQNSRECLAGARRQEESCYEYLVAENLVLERALDAEKIAEGQGS